ncbi:reverse transcriptase domain-containing protein [Tanacetum coccineum]
MEETSRITLNERCSAILLNEIPLKDKDPGNFTIPCIIGNVKINKALADLGANISLMPYSMFTRLGLGEQKPTSMWIELANKTTQYPRGIAENVIVKIDKFIFPDDFVVLDMEEDHKILIILGRPFLATAHAMIDVFNKKISFKVRNEMVTFDIEKSMKFSSPKDDTCLSIDMVDLTILDHAQEILPSDPLDSFLFKPIINYQEGKIINLWEDDNDEADQYADSVLFSNQNDEEPTSKPTLFTANKKEHEKQILKLKELPFNLDDYTVRAVLGQQIYKKFRPIYYASKTINEAQEHYTTTEKELLAVVYAFYKFQSYLIMSKTVVYTDHFALKYLFSKQDFKPRLIRWVLLLQEFTIEIKDKKGTENLVVDHLSRLENLELEKLNEEAFRDSFPNEHLMAIYVREPNADPWYLNLDSTGQLSLKMPHDMFVNARVAKGLGMSLPAIRSLYPTFWFISCGMLCANTSSDTYIATTDSVVQKRRCIVKQGPCKDLYRLGIDSDIIRTAYKSPIRSTPFRIVYGKACHLPIEIEHRAY